MNKILTGILYTLLGMVTILLMALFVWLIGIILISTFAFVGETLGKDAISLFVALIASSFILFTCYILGREVIEK